jgi:hypothetical protein
MTRMMALALARVNDGVFGNEAPGFGSVFRALI